MPILECVVRTCSYNKDNGCCLGDIKVDGEEAQTSTSTECQSFKEQTLEKYDNVCNNHDKNDDMPVDCSAKHCFFNEECSCHASSITIKGNGACRCSETECESFKKK